MTDKTTLFHLVETMGRTEDSNREVKLTWQKKRERRERREEKDASTEQNKVKNSEQNSSRECFQQSQSRLAILVVRQEEALYQSFVVIVKGDAATGNRARLNENYQLLIAEER